VQSLGAIPFDLIKFGAFFFLSRLSSLLASSSVRCSVEQSCGRREQDDHRGSAAAIIPSPAFMVRVPMIEPKND